MTSCLAGVKIRVEVPYLIFGLCFMLESSVTINFLLYRTCYVTLGYDRDDCYLLGTEYADNATKGIETEVQTYATHIFMCKSIIDAFVAPVFCFFLASWSDKYGRRPLIIIGLTGFVFSYLIMTIVSSLPYVSPWYFVLHEIPLCLSGSAVTLMTAFLSYTADISTEENRGMRLGFLEAANSIGTLIGTLSSSYVFALLGYPMVYLICLTCQFCSWMFAWFYIEESIAVVEDGRKWSALFELTPLREAVQILLKKRPNNDRATLWCVIAVVAIFTAGRFADSNVIFLYLRKNFSWSLERYTLFLGFSSISWILLCIVCVVVLVTMLRVKEIVVIVIGLVCCVFGSLVQGFATKNWHFYGAAALKSASSCVTPLTQSFIPKIAPKEDCARLFAALVSFTTVSLFLCMTFNTYVYNQTILTIPQAFNFVTATIYTFPLIMTIVISFIYKNKRADYSLIVNGEEGITTTD